MQDAEDISRHVASPGDDEGGATPLIRCDKLCKDYVMGDTVIHALDGVSLDITRGEFVAITGASGSGKSTFMHLIGVLDTPTSGGLHIDGYDVASLSGDELATFRNHKIGFVFQQFNLLARTSALENVRLPLLYSDIDVDTALDRCRDCLRRVGLSDRMDHHPAQLSGGQQQRVAIARALANDPEIILADEPTGALDTQTSEEIMELLGELNDSGVTVVLVTHEADIAAYARRQIQFSDGHVIIDTGGER